MSTALRHTTGRHHLRCEANGANTTIERRQRQGDIPSVGDTITVLNGFSQLRLCHSSRGRNLHGDHIVIGHGKGEWLNYPLVIAGIGTGDCHLYWARLGAIIQVIIDHGNGNNHATLPVGRIQCNVTDRLTFAGVSAGQRDLHSGCRLTGQGNSNGRLAGRFTQIQGCRRNQDAGTVAIILHRNGNGRNGNAMITAVATGSCCV